MENGRKTKIKRISASDQVCDNIWGNICAGIWKPSERLPPESELAELYGVNRLTVRMALQRLNTLGIIETRMGDGSYVLDASPSGHLQEVSHFYMRPELISDVFAFRKAIELNCAFLAIENATQEEITKLFLLDRAHLDFCNSIRNQLTDENVARAAQFDYDFHYHLCKSSHNQLLIYSYSLAREPILQYLRMIIRQRWSRKESLGRNFADFSHLELCQAISNRDYEACEEIYLKLIDYTQNPDFPE